MDKTTFEKYLEERYYAQMKYYGATSTKNQKWYKLFQWALIILSALAPVLAALHGNSMNTNIYVVVVSSIVAILTTGLKTFNYQESWANYRSTHEKLKPEIHYYEFNIGPYGATGVDKESLFVTRVEGILDTEHNQWPPAKKLQENQPKNKEADANSSAQKTPGNNDPAE